MSFEIGQKVWSPLFGYGWILNIQDSTINVAPYEKSHYNNSIIYSFDLNGIYTPFHKSSVPLLFHDEVKIEDWPNPQRNPVLDLKMDDLILVSVNNHDWVPRYFSYCEGDLVYVYINGTTSKTYKSVGVKTAPFKYWKKPE